METIFGGLIEFEDKNELVDFVEKVDITDSINLIEVALNYSQQSGIFTIEESHIIYKSLKKLKETYGFNSGNGELQQGEGNSPE
jgi:hypothetical protein